MSVQPIPVAQPYIVQTAQPVQPVQVVQPVQQNAIPMNAPKKKEDHSWAGVPDVDKDKALCVFFLDFFLGPLGVMISACMDRNGFNGKVFTIAIFQMLACFIFLGGIWSLISAILSLVYNKE